MVEWKKLERTSSTPFSLAESAIRYSLSAVKNMEESADRFAHEIRKVVAGTKKLSH